MFKLCNKCTKSCIPEPLKSLCEVETKISLLYQWFPVVGSTVPSHQDHFSIQLKPLSSTQSHHQVCSIQLKPLSSTQSHHQVCSVTSSPPWSLFNQINPFDNLVSLIINSDQSYQIHLNISLITQEEQFTTVESQTCSILVCTKILMFNCLLSLLLLQFNIYHMHIIIC